MGGAPSAAVTDEPAEDSGWFVVGGDEPSWRIRVLEQTDEEKRAHMEELERHFPPTKPRVFEPISEDGEELAGLLMECVRKQVEAGTPPTMKTHTLGEDGKVETIEKKIRIFT